MLLSFESSTTANFANYAKTYYNVIRVICVIRSTLLVVDKLIAAINPR